MTNETAYELGKSVSRYGTEDRFFAACSHGFEELPEFVGNDPVLDLFFSAGIRGLELPKAVTAVRIGKIPACGFSVNYRDGHREPGVSVLHLVGDSRKDNGTFTLFNGGEKITVSGYLHFKAGSDGEPILVGAKEVETAATLSN